MQNPFYQWTNTTNVRKKFTLESDWEIQVEWIEGIGSLNGLFFCSRVIYPTHNYEFNKLIGFKHQGEILYFNEDFPSFYPTDIEPIHTERKEIKVSYRLDNTICFDFNNLGIISMQIYNTAGIQLGRYKVENEEEYILSPTGYTPGIYFYQCTDKQGKSYSGKFKVK